MSVTKNVYAIGASRNIGYFASLRLLRRGTHVTVLVRTPSTLESDPAIKPYLSQNNDGTTGQVQMVKGDALNVEDVKRGWEIASQNGPVDLVLFTVGGTPRFTMRGLVIDPPNLCTQSIINVLTAIPDTVTAPPRILAVTSIGTSSSSHKSVPLLLKPLYNILLPAPHRDKVGLEKVLAHVCAKTNEWGYPSDTDPHGDELPGNILSKGWKKTQGLPKEGALPSVVIVRPALLTDGECRGDDPQVGSKPAYRVQEGDVEGPHNISRKDTAHLLVEGILHDWAKWEGKCVSLAY